MHEFFNLFSKETLIVLLIIVVSGSCYVLYAGLKILTSQISKFLSEWRDEHKEMRKDLDDVVYVNKMHEFRLTAAEKDIELLQNYKVRYQK